MEMQPRQELSYSVRNQKTKGRVLLFTSFDFIVNEKINQYVQIKRFYLKCAEHGSRSENFFTWSEALKFIHRPWVFCRECHKIVFGYRA